VMENANQPLPLLLPPSHFSLSQPCCE
jgi:hypothetical protein